MLYGSFACRFGQAASGTVLGLGLVLAEATHAKKAAKPPSRSSLEALPCKLLPKVVGILADGSQLPGLNLQSQKLRPSLSFPPPDTLQLAAPQAALRLVWSIQFNGAIWLRLFCGHPFLAGFKGNHKETNKQTHMLRAKKQLASGGH